jgi:Glycoside hydrolase 123, catalytic domain/Glycoside hydrolase 123, N-terminal domain
MPNRPHIDSDAVCKLQMKDHPPMNRMKKLTSLVCGLASLALAAGAAEGDGSRTVLNAHSFWRVHVQAAEPILRVGGKLRPEKTGLKPLAAAWNASEFDDSSWVRVPGPFFAGKYMAGFVGYEKSSVRLALICLRGRFQVTDPSAVKQMTLDLSFRGGAVVYLNGVEVARKHLPKGKVDPSALADDYPKEAYIKANGKIISWGFSDPEKNADRLALRSRKVTGVRIPTKLLRKGANVLAVELHRAPYHEAALSKKGRLFGHSGHRSFDNAWTTVGLTDLVLKAEGGGVRPNITRPAGFQVWNADALLVIYDTDYGDAGLAPRAVKIVGARNGRYSGVLVAGSDKPIEGLKASVSDLIAKESGGRIGSSAVQIRYQKPGGGAPHASLRLPGGDPRITRVTCMDALSPVSPEKVLVRAKKLRGKQNVVFGAVCPVWLTVQVPKECKPGRYQGTCTIKASGAKTVTVPVVVDVRDWTLPPAFKFRTAAGFHQSPESVAMHYKVPFWSKEHFRLLGASYKWLGSIGCKTLFVHLVERTNLGNAQSIVRWKRKKLALPAPAANGKGLPRVTLATHEPDFTALDRYLDVALKHLVEPPVICLYAWDNYCGTAYSGSATSRHNVKSRRARVTEVTADGKVRSAEGPNYQNVAEAAAFWKPVAEHVQAYLKKRGLEKSLMIGVAHDSWPAKFVVDSWQKILPRAPWAFEGHPRPGEMYGVPVQWCCTVWQASFAPPVSKGREYGWRQPKIQCHFDRDNWRRDAQTQLLGCSYLAGEKNISGKQRGFGRMSADLWPVLEDKRGRKSSISYRYPETSWGACNLRMTPFLQPGPSGAISTGRFEMIREGLQECEARISIEKALLNPAKRTRLGDALAARCQAILDERTRAVRESSGLMGGIMFIGSGWQGRNRKLFTLAGDVAARSENK